MAEEIRLDVVAVGHNRGIDDTSRALREMKSESDRAGKSFKETASASFDLDAAVAEARVEIHRLNEEFKKTGDRGLLKEIRAQQRDLDAVMKIASAGASGGGAVGGSAIDFGGAGLKPRNALIGMLVAAAAAAAPGIGAMIAGVVAGAVGTGGVAGGILMASKDSRVRAAASNFADEIGDEFFRGGAAFADPTIDAINRIKQAFFDMDVPGSFATMAPHVATIAEGFADLGRNIMPGLNTAFSRMGPFADVAGEQIGEVGNALGDFMDMVTRSPGAVAGLEMAFRMITGTIEMTGAAIKILSDLFYEWVEANVAAASAAMGFAAAVGDLETVKALDVFIDLFGGMLEQGERAPGALNTAGTAVESFGTKADLAASATGHLAGALDAAHQEFLDWAGAEIGAEEALDRLRDALKESNGSINVHNEKGREARQRLIDFAEASKLAAEKKAIEADSVEEAERVYEGYREDLIKTFDEAGRTRKEAEKLARQWMAYADMPDIFKEIHIRTIRREEDERHRRGERSADGRAAGGPIWPGTWMVGERGPEVMRIDATGHGSVYPSVAAFGNSRGGSSGGARPVYITVNGTHEDRELVARISREVQRQGGTLAVIGIR